MRRFGRTPQHSVASHNTFLSMDVPRRTRPSYAYGMDYVFESAGRLTPSGYEVEIRIPFRSLRYQSAATQDWGINIIRRVQHSGYENTWSPVLQADPSFLAKSGQLAGLTNLQRGLVLDLNPELTSSVLGAPQTPRWNYDTQQPQLGGNVRWGITNNLFLNGTANPDFSQVEADVAQAQVDPRRSLFFPEKRPFFFDNSQTPTSLSSPVWMIV